MTLGKAVEARDPGAPARRRRDPRAGRGGGQRAAGRRRRRSSSSTTSPTRAARSRSTSAPTRTPGRDNPDARPARHPRLHGHGGAPQLLLLLRRRPQPVRRRRPLPALQPLRRLRRPLRQLERRAGLADRSRRGQTPGVDSTTRTRTSRTCRRPHARSAQGGPLRRLARPEPARASPPARTSPTSASAATTARSARRARPTTAICDPGQPDASSRTAAASSPRRARPAAAGGRRRPGLPAPAARARPAPPGRRCPRTRTRSSDQLEDLLDLPGQGARGPRPRRQGRQERSGGKDTVGA